MNTERLLLCARRVQTQKWDDESAVLRAAFSDYVLAQGHVEILPPAPLFCLLLMMLEEES